MRCTHAVCDGVQPCVGVHTGLRCGQALCTLGMYTWRAGVHAGVPSALGCRGVCWRAGAAFAGADVLRVPCVDTGCWGSVPCHDALVLHVGVHTVFPCSYAACTLGCRCADCVHELRCECTSRACEVPVAGVTLLVSAGTKDTGDKHRGRRVTQLVPKDAGRDPR